MNHMAPHFVGLPMWAAITISVLAVLGAALTLLGSIGLTTFRNFYERVHAPTLGTTLGMSLVIVASIIFYSIAEGHLTLKPLLIGLFMTITAPVTLVVLARAAIYRDRVEGNNVPDDNDL